MSDYDRLFSIGEMCKCSHMMGDHFGEVVHLDGFGDEFEDRNLSHRCAMCRDCSNFVKADNLDYIEREAKKRNLNG